MSREVIRTLRSSIDAYAAHLAELETLARADDGQVTEADEQWAAIQRITAKLTRARAILDDFTDGTMPQVPGWIEVAPDTNLDLVTEARQSELQARVETEMGLGAEAPGTVLGRLMRDQSLTAAERYFIAKEAGDRWLNQSVLDDSAEAGTEGLDTEELLERGRSAIEAAVRGVGDDAEARQILARALILPSPERLRHSNRGGATRSLSDEMFMRAIDLDAAEVIRAIPGDERVLGRIAHGLEPQSWIGIDQTNPIEGLGLVTNPDLRRENYELTEERRALLLQAVADGRIHPGAADRLVSTMFAASSEDDVDERSEQRAMAGALSRVIVAGRGEMPSDEATRPIARRIDGALRHEGGRDLLFDQDISPDLRNWALNQAANDERFTGMALSEGWESPIVGQAFAEQSLARLAGRGTEPHPLTGTALATSIGQAIGLPERNLPDPDDDAAMSQGLSFDYYGENEQIERVQERILQIAAGLPAEANAETASGDTVANVTVVPVTVTSDDFGVASFPVFRVQQPDGGVSFVDHNGDVYPDFETWRDDNELQPGKMTYPEGLDLNNELAPQRDTPANTNSAIALRVLDHVATGVGVVAGVALVLGTGGTAAPFIAGAAVGAGAYGSARAGERLHDAEQRGHDIFDLSDDAVRADWIDAGASALSIGAGAARLAQPMLRVGSTGGRALSTTRAGLQLAENVGDVASFGNAVYTAAANWDKMPPEQQAMTLLQLGFQGAVQAGNMRRGGLIQNHFSFTRIRNQIEHGSPYSLTRVDQDGEVPEGLEPGGMRVDYEIDPRTGRATNLQIQSHGPPDPEMLALHTDIARQMQVAGGLSDRLGNFLSGRDPPEIGTAAWEAQLEIQKINREAQILARRLEVLGSNATQAQREDFNLRQQELADATAREIDRLEDIEAAGRGSVASPPTGQGQAEALGWPEAPEGYVWVAGPHGPHIRARDGRMPGLEYDADSGEFLYTNQPRAIIDDNVGRRRTIDGRRATIGDPVRVDGDGNPLTITGEPVRMRGPDHSKCDVVEELPDGSTYYEKDGESLTYDADGFPMFDAHAEVYLSPEHLTSRSDSAHFRAANQALAEALAENPFLAARIGLDDDAVAHITGVSRQGNYSNDPPPGFVWHHHQETGLMQLVDEDIHAVFQHTGGMAVWGGGRIRGGGT